MDFLKEKLNVYYKKHFPLVQLCKWLSYFERGGIEDRETVSEYLGRREFCFVLQGDIFHRYLSFENAPAFRDKLTSESPVRIEAGPVYNDLPVNRRKVAGGLKAEERELTFDIDLTDYDEFRTCCSGTKVCDRCWVFITVAIKSVNYVLREVFGFDHLLWVFSGRRGIHCWVCDEIARGFDQRIRSSITEFLNLGSDLRTQQLNDPMHATYDYLYETILEPAFLADVLPLDPFSKEEAVAAALQVVHIREIKKDIGEILRSTETSEAKWKRVTEYLVEESEKLALEKGALGNVVAKAIVLHMMLPRLDAKVTEIMNHLLKLPFCVHPSTGNVCIVIDPEKCDDFKLDSVPKIDGLVEGDEKTEDQFQRHLAIFQIFLDKLGGEMQRKAKKRKIEKVFSSEG